MHPDDAPHTERLWTPWRMRYIGGEAREDGCIFCNRLGTDDDVRSLILQRSDHAFVIMNLYPYNTGHVMLVPIAHEAELDALDEATLIDMATLLPPLLAALRRSLNCDGFNIGLNIGAVAGAGVAEHLHQHVVPRWEGDANFMPIIAGTMVIPEVIPATYAKLRAELAREAGEFDVVVVSDTNRPVAWLRHGALLGIEAEDDRAVWRTALASLATEGAEIVGWAGASNVNATDSAPGLVVRTPGRPAGDGWEPVPLDATGDIEDGAIADTFVRAGANLAPWIDERDGRS